MDAQRYHYIEHQILRLVLQDPDPAGYPTTVPTLLNILRQWIPNVADRETVDALKRLSPKFLTLWKWSNDEGRFVEHSSDISDDKFFYTGDMRLRRTPYTDPYLQELAARFPPPEETKEPKRLIGFRP